MHLIESLLRGAGISTALLLALVAAARGGWRLRTGLPLLLACVIAYLVCSSPARPCGGQPLMLPLVLAALAFPFAFWRLASVILEDDRRIPRAAWIGGAVMLCSGMLAALDYLQIPMPWRVGAGAVHKLLAIGFLGAAGVRAWRSREGDLVEQRRRLRWVLIAVLGLYSLAVTVVEIYLQRAPAPAWLDLLNIGLIDIALLASAAFLLGVRAQAQNDLFEPIAGQGGPAQNAARPAAAEMEEALAVRLAGLMQDQHLYRDPDLSVSRLAAALNVPEYVLRRVILARLGHRHFASFVNDYRLREVAARMADPSLVRRPILTLALEAGFGSIGPFNRCFKERHAMTPSEYRERIQSGAIAGAPDPAAIRAPG
jgi:AraC-like DNA-binding protein